jgi:hypothetical protein
VFTEKPYNWFNMSYKNHNEPVKVSKTLSKVRKDLSLVNSDTVALSSTKNIINLNNLGYLTILTKVPHKPNYLVISNSITSSESLYTRSSHLNNTRSHNSTLTLNELYTLTQSHQYPHTFNLNLKTNLDIANQQRWLTKNSLLTESIVNNSFLITQSKKLIGSGLLNKDFTNQNL